MSVLRKILARRHPALRRPFPGQDGEELSNHHLGEYGERLAALALEAKGYKILYRNFRGARGGEVDIVCRHGKILVFTEVKTRTSLKYGRPSEAVTPAKQHLILRGAKEWLARLHTDAIPVRMDVVEVLFTVGKPPDITVIEDAFGDEGSHIT